VSQKLAFPVFCFEGQKVPYPASSFLPDIKLSWRTSVADTLWSAHILKKTPICWESTMQNDPLSL